MVCYLPAEEGVGGCRAFREYRGGGRGGVEGLLEFHKYNHRWKINVGLEKEVE